MLAADVALLQVAMDAAEMPQAGTGGPSSTGAGAGAGSGAVPMTDDEAGAGDEDLHPVVAELSNARRRLESALTVGAS